MVANPFKPQELVGRQDELEQICSILGSDGDLLITGVPGSGRRTLIRCAAQAIGARVIEIDCLRTTDSNRFLKLLAEGIIAAFPDPSELALIQRWSTEHPVILEQSSHRPRLVWHTGREGTWGLLQALLALPQRMAEWLDCRVVVMFQNFPHIRSWDRSNKWEHYICQEIQWQSRVSYALIATVAEPLLKQNNLQVVALPSLPDRDIKNWMVSVMAQEGFKLADDALELFLTCVQGHFGEAIALARRTWLDRLAIEKLNEEPQISPNPISPHNVILIEAHHVHRSALTFVEDLELTFESLILLLPPSQVRVLESLALDPTDSPHSREYIQKHQLSRGGGLQGALASLEQKGLVYGAEYGYRLTMPLLAFWLKHRLS